MRMVVTSSMGGGEGRPLEVGVTALFNREGVVGVVGLGSEFSLLPVTKGGERVNLKLQFSDEIVVAWSLHDLHTCIRISLPWPGSFELYRSVIVQSAKFSYHKMK